VDAETRTFKIQATAANRGGKLRPGMFVNVAVVLPERQKVLAIPATAILYAPYSDSVFVIEENKEGKAAVSCASSSCTWANGAVTSSLSPAGSRRASLWSAPVCSSCATDSQ